MEKQKERVQLSQILSLSPARLTFTKAQKSMKLVIKNLSKKSSSFEIIILDNDHFQIINSSRIFNLAPGISKILQIKHIQGKWCSIASKKCIQGKIRQENGCVSTFQCCCSEVLKNGEQDLISYQKEVELGEFDGRVEFEVQVKNISMKNLKILFKQSGDGIKSKGSIECQNNNINIICNNDSTILLKNQIIRLNFSLQMRQYGELNQKLRFKIIDEQQIQNYLHLQQDIQNRVILVKGCSVSQKIVIKDQFLKNVQEIYNQILVGTNKISCFYLQTQYHEDVQYIVEAYIQAQTPQQYSQQWYNISLQFINNQQNIQNNRQQNNRFRGILKKGINNKIQYRLITKYTSDDQNYVSKYSKISFDDDSIALKMRNSQHSQKYQKIMLKFMVVFKKQKNILKNTNNLENNHNKNNKFYQITIPLQCTLINPNIRCQVSQSHESLSENINIIIFNETRINIPYNFPLNSLYRVISNSYAKRESKTSRPCQQLLFSTKKQVITIKWTKQKQRCPIYMQIPSFDLVLYEPRVTQLRQKNMVALPPTRRRPQTSINSASIMSKQKQRVIVGEQLDWNGIDGISRKNSQQFFKNNHGLKQFRPNTAFMPILSPQYKYHQTIIPNKISLRTSTSTKKPVILAELPKTYKGKIIQQFIPQIQNLQYLVQFDNTLKNTHPQMFFIIQVVGGPFVILYPGQLFIFDQSLKSIMGKLSGLGCYDSCLGFKYRVFGHWPIYTIKKSQVNGQNVDPFLQIKTNNDKTFGNRCNTPPSFHLSQGSCHNRYKSQFSHSPAYQVLSREMKMSFKQSKQQFEIINFIPILNCSNKPLQVNCLSLQGEFFKSKQPNGILIIPPQETGKYRVAFKPQNNIRLSILNHERPRQQNQKVQIKNLTYQSNSIIIKKQFKIMINNNVQIIQCIGEIIQKCCKIIPDNISFKNCKYGLSDLVETMIITNTSPHKINFIIDNPKQISIKPQTGTITPESSQPCTITLKPCKKLSSYSNHIKISIGGSHIQLVPLYINIQGPNVYIKQMQLQPQQFAIYGTQIQQLNLQMNVVNNCNCQSFMEINLFGTPLCLGYSWNYKSASSGNVMEKFMKCSRFMGEQEVGRVSKTGSVKGQDNSLKIIEKQDKINHQMKKRPQHKKCAVTIDPNSTMIIPLTLKVIDPKIGTNIIPLNKCIAALSDFGSIKCPKTIRYNCNKTLLQITPYKQIQQIILTQSKKNYQITLKNISQKILKIRTKIKQINLHIQNKQLDKIIGSKDNNSRKQGKDDGIEPSIICTFKDINENILPDTTTDLNINFICFEVPNKIVTATYELSIYVKQDQEQQQDISQNLIKNQIQDVQPYFITKIKAIMPEPFLQVIPKVVVMPTVSQNMWSQSSVMVRNNGYKQILLKIKKPTNIAFDFDYSVQQINQKNTKIQNRQTEFPNKLQNIKKNEKILYYKLTKINNKISIKISIKNKQKISFNIIMNIIDNFNHIYQIPIIGTCTDSPFFNLQILGNQSMSFHSLYSHQYVQELSNVNDSNRNVNDKVKYNDINDLMVLNDWMMEILPEIRNQSGFFYIWLTKSENFVKFLREFKISINLPKVDILHKKVVHHQTQRSKIQDKTNKLSSILQQLKQQGFQLNSLRVDLLQKADQYQWLNLMWFFLSKAVLYSQFLKWLSKEIKYKQSGDITYSYVLNNCHEILTKLLSNCLCLKKQSNNYKNIDWKYLIQNFQPLLINFKKIQSIRNLILNINLLYHKIKNIQRQIIQISDFQFILNVNNKFNRKVKYYLQCDPKKINCEQSSNKILPNRNINGYSFMIAQNQQIKLTFSLKNLSLNTLPTTTKNIIDLVDIIMYNNILMDSITIFNLKLKRKQDIVHNVMIQCQNKSNQQWVYQFQSKMTAWYQIQFQVLSGCNPEFIKLLTGQPGLLKKGEITTIRVVFSPSKICKCQAILKVVNPMVKEVFKINGNTLPSSKVQYQKNIKIIQNQQHKEIITINWQISSTNKSTFTPFSGVGISKNNLQNKNIGRQNEGQIKKNNLQQKTKKSHQNQKCIIKIYNPLKLCEDTEGKYNNCIIKKQTMYNMLKKQLKIILNFKYDQLVRNLQLFLLILNQNQSQSKLIRLIIDVIPSPIFIKAQIQTQFNTCIIEQIKFPNLLKISENITIQYKYIQKNSDVKKFVNFRTRTQNCVISQLQYMNSMLCNNHKGLFEVIKVKSNESISFTSNQKLLDYIQISLRFSPTENNCKGQQQTQTTASETSQNTRNKNTLIPLSSAKTKKKTNNSESQSGTKANCNHCELPFFYISATYSESLYQVTYLFQPKIKKAKSPVYSPPSQPKKQKQINPSTETLHQNIAIKQNLTNISPTNDKLIQLQKDKHFLINNMLETKMEYKDKQSNKC